jgi:hypothetical protein
MKNSSGLLRKRQSRALTCPSNRHAWNEVLHSNRQLVSLESNYATPTVTLRGTIDVHEMNQKKMSTTPM